MEPITRKEKLIAGEQLTPITREEMFLKKYGGGSGLFLVTVTQNDDGTYAADKTFAEISAAIESGASVRCVRKLDYVWLYFDLTQYITNRAIGFSASSAVPANNTEDGKAVHICELLAIAADNSVMMQTVNVTSAT